MKQQEGPIPRDGLHPDTKPELREAFELAEVLREQVKDIGAHVTIVVSSADQDQVLVLDSEENPVRAMSRMIYGLRKCSISFGYPLTPVLAEEILEEAQRNARAVQPAGPAIKV